MGYEVFESLEADGRPLHVLEVAAAGSTGETRVVGSYANWGAAISVVARLEAQSKRDARGFAFGIRAEPPLA